MFGQCQCGPEYVGWRPGGGLTHQRGLGQLYDAGSGALPVHGTAGGARLQLVDAARAARPAVQALRGDLQSAAGAVWHRHAQATRRTHRPHDHQLAYQARDHPSRADQLGGLAAYAENDCGAVDRCQTHPGDSRPRRHDIPVLNSEPSGPPKLRRQETVTAVLWLNRGLESFLEVVIQPAVLFFRHQLIPDDPDQESLFIPGPYPGDGPIELFLLLDSIGIEEGE